MHMKRSVALVLGILLLCCTPVFAEMDTGVTVYGNTTDIVVTSPYVNENLWFIITILGLIFLVLSNIVAKDQNPVLWAIISPILLFWSLWTSSGISSTYLISNFGTTEAHVNAVNIVAPQTGLTIIMGIIFILAAVNLWYCATNKPMEKTPQAEFTGNRGI